PVDQPNILREEEVIFNEEYSKEYFRSGRSSIYYSRYDEVEGFASRSSSDLLSDDGTTVTEIDFELSNATDQRATLTTRFGLGFDFHRQQISVDGNLLLSLDTNAWTMHQPSLEFTPSGSGASLRFEGTAGVRDKANIAWAKVTYLATPVYDEDLTSFLVPASNTPSRVTFSELGADAGAMKAYGAENGVLVSTTATAGTATMVFPASTADQRYYLLPAGQPRSVTGTPYRFSPTLPTNGQTDYLLVTSRDIHGASVEAMASYRRSPAGGGYNVHVVDVEDLYEEFGYGLSRHPMALRNYLSAAIETAPQLKYLFLVGKGREYDDIRTEEQRLEAEGSFFVPSFGFPASDNLLSAPVGEVVPRLSTGRLPAISDDEVGIYLDKLRGVENQINLGEQTITDREWMKTILHLGGGTSPGEQASIRNGLGQLEGTVEASDFGAN
ncbi:MAG: C25 family cysteine peptidase, partial [Bacteroidota bacterium]